MAGDERMKIYNTLTKKVEEFIPNEEGKVKMYTCGPTVYHYAHIGNLRTYISEDILEKGLRFIGYDVERVMNITDVGHLVGDGDSGEDKMLVASKREHKSSMEIAKYYTDCFFNDCMMLNIKKPDVVSPATANIEMYIKMIQKLLDTGYAYIAEGNVYYDTSKFPNYYELSGRNSEDLMVAVREDIEHDTAKRNPFDFGLWFTNSKFNNQELQWDSPWGRGYPGWHIECSAMSMKYLGETFDIHCGGIDAIPVHHTNEIAQSEAATGHKWVNYWCHGEFLLNDKGKMSKSSGEFLTLPVLVSHGYEALDYRYFCLGGHYRTQLKFSYEALDHAKSARERLNGVVAELKAKSKPAATLGEKAQSYKDSFFAALFNDLRCPEALAVMWKMVKDGSINDDEKLSLLYSMDKVLGLDLDKVEAKKEEKVGGEEEWKLVEERKQAKAEKNYQRADEIRKELETRGFIVKDTPQGPILQKIM